METSGANIRPMKAPSIDEYIEEHSARITPEEWARLGVSCLLIEKRASGADAARHPRLLPQAALLKELLTSGAPEGAVLPAEAEMAVAASYLLKGYDLIPDEIAVIGFDDDAMLLDRIFHRNRAALSAWAGRRFSADLLEKVLP